MIYQTNNIKFTLYGNVHSLKWIKFCVVCGADFTGGTSNSSTLVRRRHPLNHKCAHDTSHHAQATAMSHGAGPCYKDQYSDTSANV